MSASSDLPVLIDQLFDKLKHKGWTLVTAESCTGGMIAAAITDKAGSSTVFERGFITYSNDAKIENLSVSPSTIKAHGAVSAETAKEMAAGALKHSHADVAVSITGIAGPDGGTTEKPVGLVYTGYAIKGHPTQAHKHLFTGNRQEIRQQAVTKSVKDLINIIK